jgi:hypothetical protein
MDFSMMSESPCFNDVEMSPLDSDCFLNHGRGEGTFRQARQNRLETGVAVVGSF